MTPSLPWIQPAFSQVVAEVRANRLAHALLVEGDKGTGLEMLADAVCRYRLCHQPLEQACGQCKSCQLLEAGTHPDIKVLEPTGAGAVIKVDQVREAVNFLSQTPQISQWKLVWVSSAHRMNINAANALLKVLEEPPGNSLLLIVTDRPQLLIPTVRSRCRKLVLARPTNSETKAYCLEQGVSESQLVELVPMIGSRPITICEWVSGGQHARWKILVEGLERFKENKLSTAKLTDSLKDIDLLDILEWLMQLAASEAKNTESDSRLTWSTLYQWLVKSRQEAERGMNPNRQLLLDECFLRWKAAF